MTSTAPPSSGNAPPPTATSTPSNHAAHGWSSASQPGLARVDIPTPGARAARNRRRPMLILAAALLLLISTLAGGYAFSQISTTVAVIGMAETVPAGQIVDREDLTTIQVNEGSGLATVPADQLSDVVGLRAVTDLPAGSTLTPDSVAEVLVPTSGESIVGISTAPGTAPATGLVPGAEVLLVPLAADGEQLGKNAAEPVAGRVVSVSADAGQAGSQIDVAVASQAAPALQRLAAAQRLAIIIVSKER